jgi:hypothetical protein
MIQAGASPKMVQTVLGHRSAAFTLTVYGHLFDADLDDLAARLDSPADQRGPNSWRSSGTDALIPPDLRLRGGAGWDRTIDRGIMSPLL